MRLGGQFGWLWAAYSVSTVGTWLGFGAFPLIAVLAAHPLVTRFGRHRVLLVAGWLRVCWPIGLAFVQPGTGGLALVIAVQFALVTCMGVFNPVFATSRLDHTPPDRVARALTAWSVTNHTTTATVTALWGLLAATTSPRIAIGAAGLLILATPLLLPRRAAARWSTRGGGTASRRAGFDGSDHVRGEQACRTTAQPQRPPQQGPLRA
ncbi:MFS transporter [Saccharothrix sp.]|uniref:MFS transporter n=1 Tax=Saccharothrix sp. TaxID=1873460 RepID=UPI002810B307|nr:MFS transporter [Saccharothrix sp.]